jgi:hypothetical protein
MTRSHDVPPSTTDKVSKTIRDRFGDLWPMHNRWFGAVLTECRRQFDGDLDQVLIVTVIGTRTLYSNRIKGISYHDFLIGLRNEEPMRPINTQSIADTTGMPRESVRRKVVHLIERGWVERTENGYLSITQRAVEEISPITEMTLAYFEELQRILSKR